MIHKLGYIRVILRNSHLKKESLLLRKSEYPDAKKNMAFPMAPPTASIGNKYKSPIWELTISAIARNLRSEHEKFCLRTVLIKLQIFANGYFPRILHI